MTQPKMDINDDLAIENNNMVLTEHNSDEEISQRIKQNIRFFFGEWFLDKTEGVPWFQVIMVKGTPPDVIEGILKDRILATEGVSSLNSFDPIELDRPTRNLTVRFDVTTINGNNLTIEDVLP